MNLVVTGTKAGETLSGGEGSDQVKGLAGSDSLYGSAGNDVLTGGLGRDGVIGGDGADRFDFNSVRETSASAKCDVIRDFETGMDQIDLRDIDANQSASGNQRFSWCDGTDLETAFTGTEGELRFAHGLLMGDTNGDKNADFQIKVAGLLSAADVLL